MNDTQAIVLNKAEDIIFNQHVFSHKSGAVGAEWLIQELPALDLETIRRSLRELEQLGYVYLDCPGILPSRAQELAQGMFVAKLTNLGASHAQQRNLILRWV